jgi:hypothetical protein
MYHLLQCIEDALQLFDELEAIFFYGYKYRDCIGISLDSIIVEGSCR